MTKTTRAAGWILAAILLGMPAASGATVFVGGSKQTFVCPGLGHDHQYVPFTLDMAPGLTNGTLTYAGGAPIPVVTNWTADGQRAYFTASGNEPNGGPIVMYGFTRGARMRGWVIAQSYGTDACLGYGPLRAWGQ
jgi:hypothetical protein